MYSKNTACTERSLLTFRNQHFTVITKRPLLTSEERTGVWKDEFSKWLLPWIALCPQAILKGCDSFTKPVWKYSSDFASWKGLSALLKLCVTAARLVRQQLQNLLWPIREKCALEMLSHLENQIEKWGCKLRSRGTLHRLEMTNQSYVVILK